MPDRVVDILGSKYLTAPIRYEGMHRVEELEIPEEALREMLCNSIVHKDYLGSYIQMKVWDDHITIWNPGTLPPPFTIETLMQEHDSRPRNKLIAQVFYYAGLIETWGRGYSKISGEFQRRELQTPVFREHCGGIEANILRERLIQMNGSNVVTDVVTDLSVPLTSRQLSILGALAKEGANSANSLSLLFGTTQRTIQRDLAYLRKNGFIDKSGKSNNSPWVVKIKPKEE